MEVENHESEYNKLSNKYQFNKITFKKNESLNEVDNLIKSILEIDTKRIDRKCFDIKKNYVYLNNKLLNFFKENMQLKYIIGQLCHNDGEVSIIILEKCLFKLHSYYFHKLNNTDNEIYNEIKVISETYKNEKKNLIKNFINKWTTKEKHINIKL
jgi:hypothetical protein